jgi:hypothetical protein
VPSRKQRRRRLKERRHEYEYVYVDPEGQEVEVDEPEATPKPKKTEARKAGSKTTPGNVRKVDPPSWNRVIRRAAIFAPFILLFVYFTSKDRSSYSFVLPALLLIVFMPPLMYATDSLLYRSYQKRIASRSGSSPKSK